MNSLWSAVCHPESSDHVTASFLSESANKRQSGRFSATWFVPSACLIRFTASSFLPTVTQQKLKHHLVSNSLDEAAQQEYFNTVVRGKDAPKESLCFSGRPPTVFIARKVQLLIYEQQVGVLPSPQWSQEFVSVFYGAFIVFILSQIPLKRTMRAPGCPVQTRICKNPLEYTSPLPLGILPVWVPRRL